MSDEIDLDDIRAALQYSFNHSFFDGDGYYAPSPAIIQLENLIKEREQRGLPNVVSIMDGIAFERYFAMRLIMTKYKSLASFLSYQLHENFGGSTKQMQFFMTSLFRDNRMWFPEGCELERDTNNLAHLIKKATPPLDSDFLDDDVVVLSVTPMRRMKGDFQTSLNQIQSAILFKFLRNSKVIFPDKENLNDSTLAKVCQIVTGYKGNTRYMLGQAEGDYHKTDLAKVKTMLKNTITLIDKYLK